MNYNEKLKINQQIKFQYSTLFLSFLLFIFLGKKKKDALCLTLSVC